jgi:anti-sigma factor RsiW
LVTCKDFLSELSEYLDGSVETGLKQELERHLSECPNCWVVCDTTKKTIQIYRGVDPYPVPAGVHDRLIAALQKRAGA